MHRYSVLFSSRIPAALLIVLLGLAGAGLSWTGLSWAGQAEEIVYWNRLEDNPLALKLLRMALDNSKPKYGPYKLVASAPLEQGRMQLELAKNRSVHIANFAPDQQREQTLLPIRIPVTRGLLGFRVCLIKKGSQEKFNQITNLNSWKKSGLRIGQGTHWPDTQILEHNGLRVVKSVKYMPLFDMLAARRYDCFSRSVTEVLPELEKHAAKGVELEKNILLIYKLPTFFFVSKQNSQLAKRITEGLRQTIRDGSHDKLIRKVYAPIFKALNLKKRTALYLDNPLLTAETRKITGNKAMWFDPFKP